MRPATKASVLATLYVSQGIPYGLFSQAVPALLRQQGVSLAAIGLSTLLAIPWGLKFLWAPWVERTIGPRGRRRRCILPLQLAGVGVMLVLASMQPAASLPALLTAVFVANVLAATQDIATDGLAIDLLAPDERGLGNAIQVGGYRLGMILGGGGLLVVYEQLGPAWAFLGAAALLLLASVPAWRLQEPVPQSEPVAAPQIAVLDTIRWFVRDTKGRGWLLVLVLYKAGDHLGTGMLRPFLIDAGLSLTELGVVLGGAGFSAGLLGAFAGGWSVTWWGEGRALMVCGALQALSIAAYALVPDTMGVALIAAVVFEHGATGMATTALFVSMMQRCRADHAASDYTLQASVVVLASGLAAAVGGSAAGTWGYAATFVVGALVSAAAVTLAAIVGSARQP